MRRFQVIEKVSRDALSALLAVVLASSLIPQVAYAQQADEHDGALFGTVEESAASSAGVASTSDAASVAAQSADSQPDRSGLEDGAADESSSEAEKGAEVSEDAGEGRFGTSDDSYEADELRDELTPEETGSLEIVKRGAPVGEANAHDEFPITVELENTRSLDLGSVRVCDDDFLASPADDPHLYVADTVASVANIAGGISDAAASASAKSLRDAPLADEPVAGADRLIALIDTGAPETGNVVGRYSVVGDEPDDDNGHGTRMLESIVAENPDARVVSVKALDAEGLGTAAGVYAAIELAVSLGADVVNLSLSARDSVANAPIAKGVFDALSSGAAVIASAGNGGYDAKYFTPANLEGVYTVGAATPDGHVLASSNRGGLVDAFVEAPSTSEAAARVSGWLSCNFSDSWRSELYRLGVAVDVGDEDLSFIVDNGARLIDQIADAVVANATYTMWIIHNVNGGAVWETNSSGTRLRVTNGIIEYYSTTESRWMNFSNTLTSARKYFNMHDISTCAAYRTGYHVISEEEWNTKADLTGTKLNQACTSANSKNLVTTKILNGGKQITKNTTVTTYIAWHPNTYTVTYDANGGSGAPSATSHTYDAAKALASGKPTRSGFAFAGWRVNGAGTVYSAGQSVKNLTATDGGTVAMKARWTAVVTYNGNGGTPARASDTAEAGASVTLPGATRSGYTFKGWATSSSAKSGVTGSYTVNGNATLYATWQENNRVVNYNGNGGVSTKATDSVTPGSSVSLPGVKSYPSGHNQNTGASCTVSYDAASGQLGTLTDANTKGAQYLVYGFSGWYTAASGGTRVGAQNASYTPPFGTTTLYMQWSKTYPYRAVTLPTPTREGYDFLGWSTSASAGSGTTGSYVPAGNTLLHAIWKEQTHTVKFAANGGSGTMPDQTAYAAHDWEVPEATFKRDGYHAVWNTAADGSGTSYTPGAKVTVREDLTLYAQWVENTRATIVVHPVAGQTVTLSGIPDATAYRVIDGDQPARWQLVSKSPQLGVLAAGELESVVSESEYDLCDVTFAPNGAQGQMEPEGVIAGESCVMPESAFLYPGHHFSGWNTMPDGTGAAYAVGDEMLVEDDCTLYAQWVTPSSGEAYAVLQENGELVFFRSMESYEPGSGKTVRDLLGREYQGVVFVGIESIGRDGADACPWDASRDSIVSARVAEGHTIAVASFDGWFAGCVNLASADMGGFDASRATSTARMFSGCLKLKEVEVNLIDTSQVSDFSGLFEGCSALAELDLSGLDTSSASDMGDMFSGMEALERVKLGKRFSFAGGGIAETSCQAVLPDPPDYLSHTGKWARVEEGLQGPGITAEQLRDSYGADAVSGWYAWEVRERISVSFDAGQGSGKMPAISVPVGSGLAVPGCSFTRAGFEFKNWNTSADGTGQAIDPGEEFVPLKEITLTAQWDVLQLSFSVPAALSYVVKPDGSLVAASDEATSIVSATDAGIAVVGARSVPAPGCAITPDPKKPGDIEYSFVPAGAARFSASDAAGEGFYEVDWRIPKRASLRLAAFDGKVACWDSRDSTPREVATLIWKLGMRRITVTFDGNGADGSPSGQQANAEGEFFIPSCIYEHPDGLRFECWNTAADGSGRSLQPGDAIGFEEDTTLYAQWAGS